MSEGPAGLLCVPAGPCPGLTLCPLRGRGVGGGVPSGTPQDRAEPAYPSDLPCPPGPEHLPSRADAASTGLSGQCPPSKPAVRLYEPFRPAGGPRFVRRRWNSPESQHPRAFQGPACRLNPEYSYTNRDASQPLGGSLRGLVGNPHSLRRNPGFMTTMNSSPAVPAPPARPTAHSRPAPQLCLTRSRPAPSPERPPVCALVSAKGGEPR
jgi:hypothetical protein